MEIFPAFNLNVSDFIIRSYIVCLVNRLYICIFSSMYLECFWKGNQKPVMVTASGKDFD